MGLAWSFGWMVGLKLVVAPGVPEPVEAPDTVAAEPETPAETPPEGIDPESSTPVEEATPVDAAPTDSGGPAKTPSTADPGPPVQSPETAAPESNPDPPASSDPEPRALTFDPTAGAPGGHDDERAPSTPADRDDDPRRAPKRRGVFFTAGVGITHCPQDFCSPIAMGGLGRFELGYRTELLAAVATVSGGGGRVDDPDTNIRAVQFLDVAGGLMAFPVRRGPVDPFFGMSVGYAYSTQIYDDISTTERQYERRGAVRFSGGILWFLRPRIALGPRVDVRLPFAGKWCTRFDGDAEDNCVSIQGDIVDELGEGSGFRRRQQRRAFPRPWALTLDLRITI